MHSGRYLIGIFFFLVFFSILILYIVPNGPGNSRISGYFTIPPGDVHYSRVPTGTNVTARIVVDNTAFNAYDLINYTLTIEVTIDVVGDFDIILATRHWHNNFTVSQDHTSTIELPNITATSHGFEIRGIFINVEWSPDNLYFESVRLGLLQLGPYAAQTFFTFQNDMIIIGAIGMAIVLFIIIATARQDIQAFRRRSQPKQQPGPSQPIARAAAPPTVLSEEEPAEPSPSFTPSTTLGTVPLTHPSTAQRPVETMILIPCPQCGSKIDKHQVVCPNCGHEFQKCVVCNLIIEDDEETDSCPECGALGHRDHFREWIHVNGKCPICKTTLSS